LCTAYLLPRRHECGRRQSSGRHHHHGVGAGPNDSSRRMLASVWPVLHMPIYS
jgi:hypothetical protein